jgi:hypothetical protein
LHEQTLPGYTLEMPFGLEIESVGQLHCKPWESSPWIVSPTGRVSHLAS